MYLHQGTAKKTPKQLKKPKQTQKTPTKQKNSTATKKVSKPTNKKKLEKDINRKIYFTMSFKMLLPH